MLCRILLAVVVFTYVLCVLVLSGVQKEDLDAVTLRKLQRHNVNIGDINDQQLRNQCLGKIPIDLTTTQAIPTTTTVLTVTNSESEGLQSEETTPLKTLYKYLERMRRERKNKALESVDSTNKSEHGFQPLSKMLSTSYFGERPQQTYFENPSTELSLLKVTAKKKDNEKTKANVNTINTELEKIMNILRRNVDKKVDVTEQESTTAKILKDSISKNTIDDDYIKKIVEEIISKKQLKEVNTTTDFKPNLNTNETSGDEYQIYNAQTKNKSVALTNYSLNNCKLMNFYTNSQNHKDNFDTEKSVESGLTEPDKNSYDDGYFLCHRLKQHTIPERNDNPIVNNILNELKKESQRFKLLDKPNVIKTTLKLIPKTNQVSNEYVSKPSNNNKKTLNLIYEKPSEKKSKNVAYKSSSYNIANNISDTYNDSGESDKALQIVLQTQSKLFNEIYNQQKNLIELCNTEKDKLKLRANDSPKSLQFSQPNDRFIIKKQNEPIVRIHTFEEDRDYYPTYISENTHQLQPNLEDGQAKMISHYKAAEPDSDIINDAYKKMHFIPSNTVSNDNHAIELNDKLIITNTLNERNGVERDQKFFKVYKRPWVYAELSAERVNPKINGNKPEILFIPNSNTLITNTISPKLTKSYEKSWSPYFDNNTSVFKTKNPSSGRSNDLDLRQMMVTSKPYPKMVEVYRNYSKSPDAIKEVEPNQDKRIYPVRCQTNDETMAECLYSAKYKSDWANLRNGYSNNEKSYIRDRILEIQAFKNNMGQKSNIDSLPFIPRISMQPIDNDSTLGQYKTNIDDYTLFSKNETKSIQTAVFPPDVIKDVANSIKDYVLRDLKTRTTSPTTAITLTRTTAPSTTTVSATTITTISPTSKAMSTSTTTGETLTTTNKNPLDASKALENLMKMIEKFNLMKETIKPEIFTQAEYVTTQNPTQGQQRDKKQIEATPEYDKYIRMKEGNPISNYPQALPQNIVNIGSSVPQGSNLQTSQGNTENRVPNDRGYIQQTRDISESYRSQPVQMKEETRFQYYSPPSQIRPENRVSYDPPVNRKPENQMPYVPKIPPNIKNPTPYFSQTAQIKTESRLPYALQPLQLGPENRASYDTKPLQHSPEQEITNYLQLLQRNQGSNKLYVPQLLQPKRENQYNPQIAQNNLENAVPYVPENRTFVPDAFELKTENRMQNYLPRMQNYPQALQSKLENQQQYDLQPSQRNPGNLDPYRPLKYSPHAAEMEEQNPFVIQGANAENQAPYSRHAQYPPSQPYHNSKDRAYDYSAMDPYHGSKIEHDSHLKDVKPVLQEIQDKIKANTGTKVITLQTNSGEVSPLKIFLKKPFLQNLVITTESPRDHTIQAFDFKVRKKAKGHNVELKQSDLFLEKEDKEVTSHQTLTERHIPNLTSREIKRERDFPPRYKPRDIEEIERFHEKLEKADENDSWHRQRAKFTKRLQRPIVKNTNYDDRHFRNFLQTQQKVNAMLEKLLASGKTKPNSGQVI